MRSLLFLGALCIAPMCRADLLFTTVTGVLNFGGGTTNFYDPANGLVPTGYQNLAASQDSPTVTIVGGNEFGFNDGSNLDVTSFSGTGFTFTDTPSSTGLGELQITLQFTDVAFTSINEISSGFAGLTYGIVGDVITINIPTFTTSASSYTASFNVGSVPEPSSFALLALGAAGLAGLRKLRARTKS